MLAFHYIFVSLQLSLIVFGFLKLEREKGSIIPCIISIAILGLLDGLRYRNYDYHPVLWYDGYLISGFAIATMFEFFNIFSLNLQIVAPKIK